jgi:type IV secretory pathway VirJ component
MLPLFALGLAATCSAGPAARTLPFGRFGDVAVYAPPGEPTSVALFVSGDGGWSQGVVAMARALADRGALVAGIDVVRYLRALDTSADACSYPAADFEALSKYVQKEAGLERYRAPVLVGYSSGATLVYATLVQAPPRTFRGALSLGFCPDLPLTKPLCRGSGLEWGPGPKGRGVSFLPAAMLRAPWIALQGRIDQVCDAAAVDAFARRVALAEVVDLPKVGHGFSVPKNWQAQFLAAYERLAAHDPDPAREKAAPSASAHIDVSDLPIEEIPARGADGRTMVVHLTGDGGFGVTDEGLADELAARGVPVVSWNTLHYYWKRRTPEEAAADLARILRNYLAAWGKERAVLVGYSMGADVLPFLASRLPKDVAARVAGIVLLGPSRAVDFEFHLGSWLGESLPASARPVAPEIEKLAGEPILCECGEHDPDCICGDLPPRLVQRLLVPGGHRLGGRFEDVAEAVLRMVSTP